MLPVGCDSPRSCVLVCPVAPPRPAVLLQLLAMGQEPRQTTSNLGHLTKPTIAALINGLNRAYYSMPIAYRKNALEEKMLQVRLVVMVVLAIR